MIKFKITDESNFYFKLIISASLIFFSRVWLINNYGSAVPYWDQWDAEANLIFVPWLNGNLDWHQFLAPHNEHRILFTRLLALSLLILNDVQWDPLLEMVVNALIATAGGVVLIWILCREWCSEIQSLLLIAITFLFSLPCSWGNILAGFQSAFYLMLLFTFFSIWGLLYKPLSLRWWLGLLFSIAAFFCLASGLLVLPIIIVLAMYRTLLDRNHKFSHLFALLLCIIIFISLATLLVDMPGHTRLKPDNWQDFVTALARALAWPWVYKPILVFVIYLPFVIFSLRLFQIHRYQSQTELFVLALGGWVILQSLSIAYARGAGGSIPAPRYMDILALGGIANLCALYYLTKPPFKLSLKVNYWIVIIGRIWITFYLVSVLVFALDISRPQLENAYELRLIQLKNAKAYLETRDFKHLENKPHLHIPYPNAKRLADLLSKPEINYILPIELQVPKIPIAEKTSNTFIIDGFFRTTGQYRGEQVLGSYGKQKNSAQGLFLSEPVSFRHSFIDIPIAGYLGLEGLSFQLLPAGKEKPIMLVPAELPRESWSVLRVPNPGRPFQLIAEDKNPDYWFAFAAPRGIGLLSAASRYLLGQGRVCFFISLLLMIFILSQYGLSSSVQKSATSIPLK